MQDAYKNYKNRLDQVFRTYHDRNALVYLKEDGTRLTLHYGQFKEVQ